MQYLRDLPDKQRMRLALQWLRDNPSETPTTAARIHFHEDLPKHEFVLNALANNIQLIQESITYKITKTLLTLI